MKSIVYLFSDGTGETAERVFRAAAIQFKDKFETLKISKIINEEKLDEALEKVKKEPGIIFYTIVDQSLKRKLEKVADENSIPRVDILGKAIQTLEVVAENPPRYRPGILREMDQDYFKRVEALEFTIRHDDGKNPEGLDEADIILLGVSRTSKTPLAIYLANQGFKVANVPIIYNIELPKKLFEIPKKKIIGLMISTNRLLRIRGKRIEAFGLPSNYYHYATLREITKELSYASEIFKKIGCAVIDVSQKAIEETADEILKIIRRED